MADGTAQADASVPIATLEWSDVKQQAFQTIMRENDVSPFFEQRLRSVLCGSKKVLVLDNSASMNLGLAQTPLQAVGGAMVRRIHELVHFVRLALPVLALDSPGGVDVWFLNHASGQPGPVRVSEVHTFDQISHLVQQGLGSTPLIETLTQVLQTYRHCLDEEGVHILVTTDGAPNQGVVQGHALLHQLLSTRPKPHRSVVNFLVCTDDDKEVAYLDDIDQRCPNVDVTDDFYSERRQVLAARRVPTFSMGDYVAKAIIGGAHADMDTLDEPHPETPAPVSCCTIS